MGHLVAYNDTWVYILIHGDTNDGHYIVIHGDTRAHIVIYGDTYMSINSNTWAYIAIHGDT